MKKLSLILLALLMIACTSVGVQGDPVTVVSQGNPNVTAEPASSQAAAAAQPDAGTDLPDGPDTDPGLPLFFDYFTTFDYDELEYTDWPKEGVMFNYDFDLDGEAEEISYRITDDYDLDILFENQSYRIESTDLNGAILIDLDPNSPYLNLLIISDEGSDDYVTTELHLENGKLVPGPFVDAGCYYREGKLYFSERTEFLGTNFGSRSREGDDLHPADEWLKMSYIPTEEELADEEELAFMIEMGIVLEVIRDLPCERDGVNDFLTEGDYIYPVRFKGDDSAVECRTLTGETVVIYADSDSEWGYTIHGEEQNYYFSNIAYYD